MTSFREIDLMDTELMGECIEHSFEEANSESTNDICMVTDCKESMIFYEVSEPMANHLITHKVNFGKNDLSEMSDYDSLRADAENCSNKSRNSEVVKSGNEGPCSNMKYEMASIIENQNIGDTSLISESNKLDENLDDNKLRNEGQLSGDALKSTLSPSRSVLHSPKSYSEILLTHSSQEKCQQGINKTIDMKSKDYDSDEDTLIVDLMEYEEFWKEEEEFAKVWNLKYTREENDEEINNKKNICEVVGKVEFTEGEQSPLIGSVSTINSTFKDTDEQFKSKESTDDEERTYTNVVVTVKFTDEEDSPLTGDVYTNKSTFKGTEEKFKSKKYSDDEERIYSNVRVTVKFPEGEDSPVADDVSANKSTVNETDGQSTSKECTDDEEDGQSTSSSSKRLSSAIVKPTPPIPAEEHDDIFDPMWDSVRQLTTDEERYRQVKKCWKSATMPDPHKNLTVHSFRKRHFGDATDRQPEQRKRTATHHPRAPHDDGKRPRTCKHYLDNKIQAKKTMCMQERQKIRQKMNEEISTARNANKWRYCNARSKYKFRELRPELNNEISSIRSQYYQQEHECLAPVESEIHSLEKTRNEVLQFFSFYKGLNPDKDPTVLTHEQQMELEEIDDIYAQFDELYGAN